MKSILFWPYQVYVWLIFLPIVAVLTVVFSSLTILFAWLVNPHFASRVFATTWARICAFLTPMQVTVEGAEHAQRSRSYVVASNHQSQYDILVIYGWLKLDLKWVMKAELRKLPAIGIGCEKAGHIFVERRNPKQAAQAITEALAHRHPVLPGGHAQPGWPLAAVQERRLPDRHRPATSITAGHAGRNARYPAGAHPAAVSRQSTDGHPSAHRDHRHERRPGR
jgi:xanthine/CO dehydrogenase XdhC/CoxF family maturation factor